MKFNSPTPAQLTEAKRHRGKLWRSHFALLPRRLVDEDGRQTSTVAWLETISIRSRDSDGNGPWLYGPLPFLVSQPNVRY